MPVSMRKKKQKFPFIVISAANQWDSGMIVFTVMNRSLLSNRKSIFQIGTG